MTESENKYQMLFNSIDEGFCIIEMIFDDHEKPVDYRFLEVNPSFGKQTGLINAQGKRMRELAPGHEEYWFEIYGEIALTGKPQRFVNRAEQLHRWYDVYAFRTGKPESRQVAIIFKDITGYKLAETDLRESEARFRSIFENSVMGISQAYPGGKFIRINKAYAEMYGYPDTATMLEEVSENTIKLYANPLDREKVLKIIDDKGNMAPTEFELKRRNGGNFWALVGAKQVRDESGNLLYLQAEHIDITELKNTEKELKESRKKYRNLSQHLEEIIEKERSAIAMNLHDDLGQRLTALDLDLAWIRGRIGVQSPAVKKKLTEMRLMINEIVDSTKEIASFLRPAILFDLGLFPAISLLLSKFEKTSGIRCHLQSGTEEIHIEDRISLVIYRILQEALTNIARHSGATTTEITISLIEKRIIMSIKDNGKGIDLEKINSINSMGITGIRERVKSVNGEVQFNGSKESGTIIFLLIPLNQTDND